MSDHCKAVTNRRSWLKTGAVSAGTFATIGALVPNRWQKPIINHVLMPAHAQMSFAGSLRDPCDVQLVSGDATSTEVVVQVTGSVIPPTGGVDVTITAVTMPLGGTAGPINVVTAADGTYASPDITLTGPGINTVDVTTDIGTDTASCLLDVVAVGGGGGSGSGSSSGSSSGSGSGTDPELPDLPPLA